MPTGRAGFRAGVQQHDDEDEQHHDRAGINDHLRGRDELRAQQQIQHRQRAHHADQRERARDRMRLHHQLMAQTTAISGEDQKQDSVHSFTANTAPPADAVTSRLEWRTGNMNFQANAINWS